MVGGINRHYQAFGRRSTTFRVNPPAPLDLGSSGFRPRTNGRLSAFAPGSAWRVCTKNNSRPRTDGHAFPDTQYRYQFSQTLVLQLAARVGLEKQYAPSHGRPEVSGHTLQAHTRTHFWASMRTQNRTPCSHFGLATVNCAATRARPRAGAPPPPVVRMMGDTLTSRSAATSSRSLGTPAVSSRMWSSCLCERRRARHRPTPIRSRL